MKIPVTTRAEQTTIQYRNYKAIDTESFKDDIKKSTLITNPCQNVSDLANQYQDCLTSILDKHAPVHKKRISPKPPNPWMTADILGAKRRRRYLERVWRKTPTSLNRSRFTRQTHLCNRMMAKAKSAYYSKEIDKNSGDQRSLWKAFNLILHRRSPIKLPECISLADLAKTFGSFFIDKITLIRSKFPTCPNVQQHTRLNVPEMSEFCLASEEEIWRLIMTSPNKSCDLDPIPTPLLKSCIDVLITPITTMVNMSLSQGTFPTSFKTAHVSPLLKKTFSF